MKKILALTLSAVLAMGMMTTALAAKGGDIAYKGDGEIRLGDETDNWNLTDTEHSNPNWVLGNDVKMEPGETYEWIVSGVSRLYYDTDSKDKVNYVGTDSSKTEIGSAEELFDIIDDNKATLKVSTSYGKEYVESIKLEKKVDEYHLVITTKDTLSTKDGEFGFELSLKAKGGATFNESVMTVKKVKVGFEVFKIQTTSATGMEVGNSKDGNIVNTADMEPTEEFEFTFGDETAMFIVDLDENDGKKNVAYTTKPNDALIDANPTALMQFFAGKAAPKFNNIGDLYLYADQDIYKYVYEITADGSLKAVNAKYDEDEEAYLIKTRQIGSYVMSDVELVGAATPSTPTVPGETSTVPGETSTVPGVDGTGKPNPETGANDMVNVAVAMAVVSLAAAGAVAFKKSSK